MLRHIKNPDIFRNIPLQPYPGMFCTLHIVLRQIQDYLRLLYARYVSSIFNHIHNVKQIEKYLPTFEYISADSGIFKILAQLDIFMFIKPYLEPRA